MHPFNWPMLSPKGFTIIFCFDLSRSGVGSSAVNRKRSCLGAWMGFPFHQRFAGVNFRRRPTKKPQTLDRVNSNWSLYSRSTLQPQRNQFHLGQARTSEDPNETLTDLAGRTPIVLCDIYPTIGNDSNVYRKKNKASKWSWCCKWNNIDWAFVAENLGDGGTQLQGVVPKESKRCFELTSLFFFLCVAMWWIEGSEGIKGHVGLL